MSRVTLRIAGAMLALLAGPVLALTAFQHDEFRGDGGRYDAFPGCPPPTTAGAGTCDAFTCGLLDHAALFDRGRDKEGYLSGLLRLFRARGLVREAEEARRQLDVVNFDWGGLGWSLGAQLAASHCREDKARDLILRAEDGFRNAAETEARLEGLSLAAWTRARIGLSEGVAERLAELREQIGQAAQTINPRQLRKAKRAVALAAAEIGDFDMATALIPSDDLPWSVRGEIAQVAVRQGRLQTASALLGDVSRLSFNDASIFQARLDLVMALARAGQRDEAIAAGAAWSEHHAGGSQRPDAIRIIALEMARSDPAAALRFLQAEHSFYDGNRCINAVALAAARAGLPEQAEAILDPAEGGNIDEARILVTDRDIAFSMMISERIHRPTTAEEAERGSRKGRASLARDNAGKAFIAASIAVALAYRDKGRADQAVAVLDRAASTRALMSDSWYRSAKRPQSIGPFNMIASAYAQIGHPMKGWALYEADRKNSTEPPDDEALARMRPDFWTGNARVLAMQGRFAEALALPDEHGDGGAARLLTIVRAVASGAENLPPRPLLSEFCPTEEYRS